MSLVLDISFECLLKKSVVLVKFDGNLIGRNIRMHHLKYHKKIIFHFQVSISFNDQ